MAFKRGNPAWTKGNSGNTAGRPRNAAAEELREAIKKVEKRKRKKLFTHFVERAYENDKVLIALMKKVIPDKKEYELIGDLIININEKFNDGRKRSKS